MHRAILMWAVLFIIGSISIRQCATYPTVDSAELTMARKKLRDYLESNENLAIYSQKRAGNVYGGKLNETLFLYTLLLAECEPEFSSIGLISS